MLSAQACTLSLLAHDIMAKVIVFTGATSGLGLCSASSLAEQGHRLVIIARSETKGKDLLSKLPAKDVKHSLYLGDMSHVADVKRLAEEVSAAEPKIDVLINNAGGE
jgi:short-subunit dehydrogenase